MSVSQIGQCSASHSYRSLLHLIPRGFPVQRRGVKSKATVLLDELPQGVLRAESKPSSTSDDGPAYPTVVQEARNNMRKFDNCVLLTRVGGFYELYLEHAEEYGPLLNLKVAQKKTTAGPVSMAGFPFFQLDRFLKILVQDLNKYVAISEEFSNNASSKVKSGGLLFSRKVTRVVTPGTLVDEKFIDPCSNNFLLAIFVQDIDHEVPREAIAISSLALREAVLLRLKDQPAGLAWLDLSAGEFYTQSTTISALPTSLVRIGAREIIMDNAMSDCLKQSVTAVLGHYSNLVTWQSNMPSHKNVSEWSHMLETPIPDSEQRMFTNQEVVAGSMLLGYVTDKLQGFGIKLQAPIRRLINESMMIDRHSMRGLEVLETSRDGLSGASPSTSLAVINQRLDLVECFTQNVDLRADIVNLLRRTHDSQRLVQKFSLGRGDADDLISLLRTIVATQSIAEVLKQNIARAPFENESSNICHALGQAFKQLALDGPGLLAARIQNTIDEDGLDARQREEENESAKLVSMAQGILQSEGAADDLEAFSQITRSKPTPRTLTEQSLDDADVWIMCRTASPTLKRLHESLRVLFDTKSLLTADLRQRSGVTSLTLRWTPGLGHICHVRGVKDVRTSTSTLATARNASSTKSTRSLYLPEWSSLGGQIDQMKVRIRAEEQCVFQELREQVVANLVKLRRNAAVLDELDVACSLAAVAVEQGFVRPSLNIGTSHKVIGGRHPTVKLGLDEQGRTFISNDCLVGDKQRIWLITGPNMAGKSTFLRQNALISILAQIGSFVPAEHAEIGIVDQIFSRVGSADSLFEDQSTFMVEMLETASILKTATPRSFVIMDEVGRGTTPEDGIAVGFACLHHLYHTNRCRTLFATHFHVLADMTSEWDELGCYCTDVVDTPSGAFSYVHRLKPGVNRQSHALKVARLAGIPESVIDVAQQVQKTLGRSSK
ncbi:MAG: hypothetical protein Q9187_002311 [Circinaria calcarea]